jgi:hypothetical protein
LTAKASLACFPVERDMTLAMKAIGELLVEAACFRTDVCLPLPRSVYRSVGEGVVPRGEAASFTLDMIHAPALRLEDLARFSSPLWIALFR